MGGFSDGSLESAPQADEAESNLTITAQRMRRLLSFVTRRSKHPAQAEDALSEALVRVQSHRSGQPARNLDALIVKTALNVEIDNFRRETRQGVHADISCYLDLRDGAPLQDQVVIMKQRLARVQAGIDALPVRSREALLMRRLEGLSYREIAARMRISESAVEKHVANAVHFLLDWSAEW